MSIIPQQKLNLKKKEVHELSEEKSFPHFSTKIQKSFKTLKEHWSCLVYWQQRCLQNSLCATASFWGTKKDHSFLRMKKVNDHRHDRGI